MNAPKVKYEVVYNGKNITRSILDYVISISYTDRAKGEADEISIMLEDTDKLWQNEWYPIKGDTVSVKIIDALGTLDCGLFTIDEMTGEYSDSGDIFTIKGIAASVSKKLRTNNSYAHENKTLREIANTIASKHGLKLQGNVEEIKIERVTQYRETDLAFLKRLANEYGYTFSIRDKKLTFTSVYEIENRDAALTFKRNEVVSVSISDKTNKTYTSSTVSHHNPKKKKVYAFTFDETRPAFNGVKSDTLQLKIRAENKQQAMLKAKAALYNANSLQQEGNIQVPGNIYAISGNACELEGFGRFSGKYFIHESTHTVDRDGGYTTSPQIKRIGLVLKSKEKA